MNIERYARLYDRIFLFTKQLESANNSTVRFLKEALKSPAFLSDYTKRNEFLRNLYLAKEDWEKDLEMISKIINSLD